jgi:hypothetical protein
MTRHTSTRCLVATAILACALTLGSGSRVLAQAGDRDRPGGREQEGRRPKVTLRAQPMVAVAPARIVLTAELTGGSDDFEDYYCPSVEWEWGDDTKSEALVDCDPYEAGKSQIKRRYTIQHQFRRPGAFKVYFHLKRKDKTVASASATVQIQPGAADPPY